MVHPGRAQGICLIHCTGTTAGFMESLKDKVSISNNSSRLCVCF